MTVEAQLALWIRVLGPVANPVRLRLWEEARDLVRQRVLFVVWASGAGFQARLQIWEQVNS